MVDGPGLAICADCVSACKDIIADSEAAVPAGPGKLPTPAQIKAHLDLWVVGQTAAKRRLAVSVHNHYKRVGLPGSPPRHDRDGVEPGKANVLMLGPTGSGKTLLARTLARFLRVPLLMADATALTEAGYVGEDVESLIGALYDTCDGDLDACERGIIFLDEVDKLARRTTSDPSGRDVGGEGVQHALLSLLEGREVRLPKRRGRQDISVDTHGILFILGGAFVGLDDIIERRTGRNRIGFKTPRKSSANDCAYALPEPRDLCAFGLVPELVGRIAVIARLHDLDELALVRVLRDPRDALIKQYQLLFRMDGIRLRFTDGSLAAAARLAAEEGMGARGLRAVLERTLLPLMFELPSRDDVREVWVTARAMRGEAEADLVLRSETG
jgi:ATP-dependent Clp protease ATP-binding subunit ClpX